ncbi:MAG: DUF1684 domain-containing protein [Syntrophaceae bacterium]|nr:DUF1684 domain-containing protein [Syntrophaceae bacterium]
MKKIIPKGRQRLLFLILNFCLLLITLKATPPLAGVEEDPRDHREEKLKAFRINRDKFFKEDPRSPLKETDRKRFRGLSYYPIEIKYAMVGTIERYPTEPKPLYVNLPTNKGREKKYVKYGRFKFKLEGKEYVLQIYRPLGGGDLFLPFKDKTSGKETYPEGRYLYIEPMPGGKVLIDFNRAYNPFCEYNEKYTCPFAPTENWLDIEIRAGEKRFR